MNCRLYAQRARRETGSNIGCAFSRSFLQPHLPEGLTHPQRVNSKERILHPMKRVGKRGENKFEQITWDEAIEYIGNKS